MDGDAAMQTGQDVICILRFYMEDSLGAMLALLGHPALFVMSRLSVVLTEGFSASQQFVHIGWIVTYPPHPTLSYPQGKWTEVLIYCGILCKLSFTGDQEWIETA